MEQDQPAEPNTAVVAVVFEGFLGLLAVGLGGWLGYPPGPAIHWNLHAAAVGVLASLPLLVFLGLCVWVPVWPLRQIMQVVDDLLIPMFTPCTVLELAIISLVAGFGEESLFRGVVQEAIAGWVGGSTGIWCGLAAASLLFGLAHFVTSSYLVMASLMGLYLGWLWIGSDNLLVSITAHAVYDFLALVYLVKIRKRSSGGP